MPRASFPAAAPAEFKKQQGFLPIVLVDILLRDGTTYYFSDVGGTYTVKLGAGPTAVYSPWIVSAGPFTFTKGQQTDAGDLVLQNISGNSIERDMAKAMKAHEFEGALCVIRYWHALLALSVLEFHGTLGNQRDLGDTCDFRFKQLMDANRLDALVDPLSEPCPWTFKTDPRCGSTGVATTCDKTYTQCSDANHLAVEHHGGIPIVPPQFESIETELIGPPRTRYYEPSETTKVSVNATHRTKALGGFRPIAYGPNRAHGTRMMVHNIFGGGSSGLGVGTHFLALGEGEWEACDRVWFAKVPKDPTDTAIFHFHRGADGTLGAGLATTSTGPDQGVDSFYSGIPVGVPLLTFSHLAWCAYTGASIPKDLTQVPEFEGDFRCKRVRIFDNAGNQTYQYSTNPAWITLDMIIARFIKRQQTTGQVLTATEKARINFASWVSAAADCDVDIGGGIKRFEAGFVIAEQTKLSQPLGKALALFRGYVLEIDGQFNCFVDKARASTFTLTSEHIVGRFQRQSVTEQLSAPNRFIGHFRDLNGVPICNIDTPAHSGVVRVNATSIVTVKTVTAHLCRVGDFISLENVTDASFNGRFKILTVPTGTTFTFSQAGANATSGNGDIFRDESRYMDSSKTIDHTEHQLLAGQLLNGATTPTQTTVEFDFGNNTYERVERLLKYIAVRTLGVGLETADLAGAVYRLPAVGTLEAWMHSVDAANNALLAQLPGDVITLHRSCSEEWAADYEITQLIVPRIARDMSPDDLKVRLIVAEMITASFTDVAGGQVVKAATYPVGASPVQEDGRYAANGYHDSAARAESTTPRSGFTTALVYTTVSSFTIHIPPGQTKFQALLTLTNPDAASFLRGAGSGGTDGGGSFAWGGSANVTAEDGVSATATITTAATTDGLDAQTFGFSIPSYHTILGVSVRIKKKASVATQVKDVVVKILKAGAPVGTNKADTTNFWGTVLADAIYGGAADLWGTTLTPADVNAAGFGIVISANRASGSVVASVDYVEITITTDRGSVSAKARLKIGAQVGTDLLLTSPATSASILHAVTGVTPGSDILVEVQGAITSAAGNVSVNADQLQYTDQGYKHFDL
jgi:hypothetical protein